MKSASGTISLLENGRIPIRGLSLTQPWATLLATGKKGIETRSWQTGWRGLVAIHASKNFPAHCRNFINEEPAFSVALRDVETFPTGAILAVGVLEDIAQIPGEGDPFQNVLGPYVGAEPFAGRFGQSVPPKMPELAFGDYTPGRFAWWFSKVQQLPAPIPCSGALSLWKLPDGVIAQIEAAFPKIAEEFHAN